MWIDFEGIDGSGKTTVSVAIARRLRASGRAVYHVREQGTFRSRLTQGIRALTRDAESVLICPETELLLYAAREAQLLDEEIRPALARGDIVITDRGLYSHRAVARHVRGLSPAGTEAVTEFASGGLWPDVVIFFDVDPAIARLRKRLGKIRDRRLGMSGRKGLQGLRLARLTREAFRSMAAADPRRWHVIDNTWRSVDEAEREALSVLAPVLGLDGAVSAGPAPELRIAPAGSLEGWTENYFDFVDQVYGRDAAMATLLVAGLSHPRAAAVRAESMRRHPDLVAWSIGGLDTPEAWDIRRRAVEEAPYHVARSLTGLVDAQSWRWREHLADVVPEQVLHTLSGLEEPRAHQMRQKLWSAAPEEGLRSLGGLTDAGSWGLRFRALRQGKSGALAESLWGIGFEVAWDFRNRLRDEFPLSVLRSVKRLDDRRAWQMREQMKAHAPRLVLDGISGLDGPQARKVRHDLERDYPEESAASLAGLETRASWRERRRRVDSAPVGVLASLYGAGDKPEAVALAEQALDRAAGDLRAVRKAAVFHLVKSRQPTGEAALV